MNNNTKRKSGDLPDEKKKQPLGKSFSSTTDELNSFAGKFAGGKQGQLLTAVSNNKDDSQLLNIEQEDNPRRTQQPIIVVIQPGK